MPILIGNQVCDVFFVGSDMCGRFTIQYSWAEYYEALNLIPAEAKGRNDPPRYNVCPTQDIGFVYSEDDEVKVKDGRWGLIPNWAKEGGKLPLMINARSETVAEKNSFKHSFKSKRCLIPANAYYEWTIGEDGKRDPHYLYLKEREAFFFAGIWAYNKNMDVTSCAILTAAPTDNIAHIHDRMPVILKADVYHDWISKDVESEKALELIDQNRGTELTAYRVDRAVNSNRAQGRELIEPIAS